jgi:hypothetical protein
MLLNLMGYFRKSEMQWKILVALVLAYEASVFMGCHPKNEASADCDEGSSDCDPPLAIHDPNYAAGATLSLRTPAPGGNGVTLFARTGAIVPIDQKSSAPITFPIAATTGQGSHSEYWRVPLLAGVTVPASNLNVPVPNLSFEAFLGGQVRNQELALNLNAGSGTQHYTSLDPAFGAGVQYYLGKFYGVPTSLGANYTWDFALGNKSLTVNSTTIPGVTYTLNNPPHVSGTAAVTLNFDLNR